MIAGALRLAGLSMRMILALFMARYMSFTDIGIFSLLVGLTGLLPGAAGLGISYFVNRDIIEMDGFAAAVLARDRLIVTALCGVICSAGVALTAAMGGVALPVNLWVCAIVIIIEMIGFDLHLLLISRNRATTANFLLLSRSALWIPIFMGLAYFWPEFRQVNALVVTWMCGLLVYLLTAAVLLRGTVASTQLWSVPFDHKWMRYTVRRAVAIWISDFALAVGQNADRFIISSVMGVATAGVYYFYFSIGNAAFLVVQSATTQPYMPRLRRLFGQRDYPAFIAAVRRCLWKLIAFAVITFALAEVSTIVLVRLLDRPELAASSIVMPIMLVGMMGKAINDYLGIIDYLMERDTRFIALNLLSFVLGIVAVIVATRMFGLVGAAGGMALTALLFAAARGGIWRRSAQNLRSISAEAIRL